MIVIRSLQKLCSHKLPLVVAPVDYLTGTDFS